jgi:hypothetical protein
MSIDDIDLKHLHKTYRVTFALALELAANSKIDITKELGELYKNTRLSREILDSQGLRSSIDRDDIQNMLDRFTIWKASTIEFFNVLEQVKHLSPSPRRIVDFRDQIDKNLRFMTSEKRTELLDSIPENADATRLERLYHYGATVGEFWRCRLIQLADELGQSPDVDLIKILKVAPEYICRELMVRGELVAYLKMCHGIVKVAATKLSKPQKGILSIILKETDERIESLRWVPLEIFQERYSGADSLSRSLKELYNRKLLIKSGKRKTTAVQLTHLGFMVCYIHFREIFAEF